MKKLFVISLLAFSLVLSLQPQRLLAVSDPDSMLLLSARVYPNVLESGDLLVVVAYNLEYTSAPDESISRTYLVRFLTQAGLELQTVTPFSYYNRGYAPGVVSFYFTGLQASTLGISSENVYIVKMQGNPGVFPSPPSVQTSDLFWVSALLSKGALKSDVVGLATLLEDVWVDVSLIVNTPEGPAFTAEGDTYFSNTIPSLRSMVPSLFTGGTTTPVIPERESSMEYRNALARFWEDTDIGRAVQNLADHLGIDHLLLKTIFLIAFCILVATAVTAVTQRPDFAPLTFGVLFPLGAYVGMTDMKLAALLAAGGVVTTAFILFLRRA